MKNLASASIRRHFSTAVSKHVLVVGGNGALGKSIVEKAQQYNRKAISVDYKMNEAADINILLDASLSWDKAYQNAIQELSSIENISTVVNAAGSWAGGAVDSDDIFASTDAMLDTNLKSSVAAAHLAAKCFDGSACDNLLVLTGAEPPVKGGTGK